ncbi:hypothetical protein [Pseudoalteromonas distincta]|uniref:hypothetical protein n=1 Tax=Pseudoalteromonas distincta TaxID=77608 RepID=UPI0039E9D8AE
MKLDLIIPALETINTSLINKGISGLTLIGFIICNILRRVNAQKTSQRLLNSASIQTNTYTAFRVENLLRGIRKHSLFNKNIIKRFIEIICSLCVQIITANLLIGNNNEVK